MKKHITTFYLDEHVFEQLIPVVNRSKLVNTILTEHFKLVGPEATPTSQSVHADAKAKYMRRSRETVYPCLVCGIEGAYMGSDDRPYCEEHLQ